MGLIDRLLTDPGVRARRDEFAWRQDYRSAQADQREARRERQRELDRQQRANAAAVTQRQRDNAALARQYADQEKSWYSQPRTVFVGGNNENGKPLKVAHFSAPLPLAFLAHPDAPDKPVTFGPGFIRSRNGNLMNDTTWRDQAKETLAVWQDVKGRYQTVLGRLRDDQWWRELTHAAGLTHSVTTDEHWQGEYATGTRKLTTVTVPKISKVNIAEDGLRITIGLDVHNPPKAWAARVDTLRSAFKSAGMSASNLRVTETSSGAPLLVFGDRDTLSEPLEPLVHPYDEDKGKSYLGRAADGSDVFLTWKNNASSLIAGMQGSGKTASLMPMVAGLAGKVELHIVDCGASGEWEIFSPVCASYNDSGDLDAVAAVMRYALEVSVERMKRIRSFGAINFWDLTLEQRRAAGLHHVVIILEEAPMALGQGQSDKEDKKLAEANMSLTGRTVKTVRKAGITVVLVAQKPAATEIPTIIRDNSAQRLCFRLDSDVAAATVLGDSAYAEPKPTSIPAGKPGRFIARVDHRGNVYGQSVYVPVDGIASYLADQKRVPKLKVGTAASDDGVPAPAPVDVPSEPATGAGASPVSAMTDAERAEAVRQEAIKLGLLPPDPQPDSANDGSTPDRSVTPPSSSGFDF